MQTGFASKFARKRAIMSVQSCVASIALTANGTQTQNYGAIIQSLAEAQRNGSKTLKQAGQ